MANKTPKKRVPASLGAVRDTNEPTQGQRNERQTVAACVVTHGTNRQSAWWLAEVSVLIPNRTSPAHAEDIQSIGRQPIMNSTRDEPHWPNPCATEFKAAAVQCRSPHLSRDCGTSAQRRSEQGQWLRPTATPKPAHTASHNLTAAAQPAVCFHTQDPTHCWYNTPCDTHHACPVNTAQLTPCTSHTSCLPHHPHQHTHRTSRASKESAAEMKTFMQGFKQN